MDWCLFHREQNAVERLEIDKKNSEKLRQEGGKLEDKLKVRRRNSF